MRRSNLSLIVFAQQLKTFTAKTAAPIVVPAVVDLGAGGGKGRRRLAGTGNYVALSEPPGEVKKQRVPRETQRIVATDLDRDLINWLRLAEARRLASQRLTEQAAAVAALARRAETAEALADQLVALDGEEEALLLLLMAA